MKLEDNRRKMRLQSYGMGSLVDDESVELEMDNGVNNASFEIGMRKLRPVEP